MEISAARWVRRAQTPPEPGELLLDLRRISSKRVQKYRNVEIFDWFPERR